MSFYLCILTEACLCFYNYLSPTLLFSIRRACEPLSPLDLTRKLDFGSVINFCFAGRASPNSQVKSPLLCFIPFWEGESPSQVKPMPNTLGFRIRASGFAKQTVDRQRSVDNWVPFNCKFGRDGPGLCWYFLCSDRRPSIENNTLEPTSIVLSSLLLKNNLRCV